MGALELNASGGGPGDAGRRADCGSGRRSRNLLEVEVRDQPPEVEDVPARRAACELAPRRLGGDTRVESSSEMASAESHHRPSDAVLLKLAHQQVILRTCPGTMCSRAKTLHSQEGRGDPDSCGVPTKISTFLSEPRMCRGRCLLASIFV